jgi:flagella basal body P-ring formation protein FlgA
MTWMALLLAVRVGPTSCLPIADEHVRAADLAAAVPEFSAVAPETVLGFAPAPGARRVISREELGRLAVLHKIDARPASDVCLEWETRMVGKEEVIAAMRASIGEPEARIDVLEVSQAPAPRGEMVFPRDSLPKTPASGPAAGVLWKGYVRYGGQRRFDIWARVRITSASSRVVVVSPIKTGEIISAGQVKSELSDSFGFDSLAVRSLSEVVGHVAKRSLQPGAAILGQYIEAPKVVLKGDIVGVEVRSGGTRLRLDGTAETSGNMGQVIRVRNTQSGRTFTARVVGPGAVLVAPQGSGFSRELKGGSE